MLNKVLLIPILSFISFGAISNDRKLPLQQCSKPIKNVEYLIKPVLHAREHDYLNYESTLDTLHKNKSNDATEAIVRLMSVYLGSGPSTLNSCEVYNRKAEAVKYLSESTYCLDSIIVNGAFELLPPLQVIEKKEYIIKMLNEPDVGWCDFDA